MAHEGARWLDEIRVRVALALGSPTLVLAIAEHDAAVDEAHCLLAALLRATPFTVADLGVGSVEIGPRRWAKLTRAHLPVPADTYVIGAAPATPLGLKPMVHLYNAERELLRELAGPLIVVVSSATEKAIRQESMDFFTWVARSYVLPLTGELAALAKAAEQDPGRMTDG